MTPGTFNLKMYRGDSYVWRFMLWSDTNQTVPLDLTGATAAAEIRDKTAGTKVTMLVCTVTQPNIIDVEMTPALYTTTPATGFWDLQITLPGGRVHTPVAGTVTVTADITQSVAAPLLLRGGR